MFNMLASKIGEAQAFADGLVNLDALSMDRLLEEQEREERSKDESLRLLRASGDATDVTYYHDADVRGESESSRSTAAAAAAVDDDIELQQLSTDSNKFRSAEAEDGGNFEDEFDPILASIRKPTSRDPKRASPRRRSTSPTPTGQTTAASASALEGFESSFLSGESRDRDLDTSVTDDGENAAAGAASKGVFASGLLSMFPENMRARAEGVMAQSSASISKSAGAFRSALETGGAAAAAGKGKRRESDPPPYPTDAALRAEEGRGKNGAGGGRRMLGDTDDDVPMVNVNDLLSDDERQQLASFYGGPGRTSGVCGWRRRPKYVLVGAAVGVAIIGVYCLWRWTALMLGLEEDGVAALDTGRR